MTAPDPGAGRVAAVDLGGTKTAACLVDRAGVCGPVLTRPTPAMAGPERVLDHIAALIRDLTGNADGDRLVGVGVGSAGIIDTGTGRVVSATKAIAHWPGTNIAAGLKHRLGGVSVVVDNDVNAHAAGESWLGAGRGRRRVFMAAVGTGIGGALVVDGHPVRGAHHVAGEIGHIPARGADHLTCACGRPGHLEAIGSGPGLLHHFHSLGGDPAVCETRDIFAAVDGDRVAARAVQDAAQALGRCLAGIRTTVDPEVVIIGGGMAGAGQVWWRPMDEALRAEVVDVLQPVPLVPAELGGQAALVGAARLAWTELPVGEEER
jgi:glucokinase